MGKEQLQPPQEPPKDPLKDLTPDKIEQILSEDDVLGQFPTVNKNANTQGGPSG